MSEWTPILERFEYDLWANQLWLAALAKKGLPQPDTAIFAHILSAQSIWLSRCHGTSPQSMPEIDVEERSLLRLNEGWRGQFEGTLQDRVVKFQRTTGEALSLRLSQIAWHVLNHGTYHRGELRGLCRARSDEEFPETDLARFHFEAGLNP